VTEVPNQYYLQGGGISVAYSPEGFGPIRVDLGPLILAYHDANRSQGFYRDGVQTVEVADLGNIVSVALTLKELIGSTTFSLLIPDVQLPEGENSVPITTEAITTLHRLFPPPPFGGAQREVYTVTELTGTAINGPLPL
jgi:hypothetical protein